MIWVKDNITGVIYYTDKLDLRDVLEGMFDLAQDGVVSAIDAVCDDPFDPSNYWAEDFLNICIREEQ